MSRCLIGLLCFFVSLALVLAVAPPAGLTLDKYHQPEEVVSLLKSWRAQHPQLTKLLNIGKSTGKNDIFVLRIAAQGKNSSNPDTRPSVFISANVEGYHLVGTEAALMLAEKLLTKYGSDKKVTSLLERRTVYVAPLLNPDVAQAYFSSTRYERRRNRLSMDDDLDDLIDEDGPDDFNNDGLITQIRVKDPEGTMIPDPSDPRLMRKADPKKGEKGIYKIYTESLDNDGDGLYNEDPPGGVEINRNFPHDFEYFVKPAGLWPVSQKETIALVQFLTSHKNIAMILNFSTENTFLNLQQTGQARAAADKVKVPARFASFLGLDPDVEYTLKEIVDVVNASGITGGQQVDESMVAMFLGLGAAMSIDRLDMPLIQEIQKDYKDALKKAELGYPESRAKGVRKGSFVAYCYFQYGVPVFSADLWAVPEPKKEPDEKKKDVLTLEKLKSMSSEDFLALDDEIIEDFLKEQGAPANFKASMVKDMVKAGRITLERMVQMMENMPKKPAAKEGEHPESYILIWSDEVLKGKGFVDWAPFKHPTLGEVEIGGFVPYLKVTPPPAELKKTIDFHTNYYIEFMNRLPQLEIKETLVKTLGNGVYQVTVYFTNTGWFPTSTAQGRRARAAWPIRAELNLARGQSLFSGRSVVNIPFIDGSGGIQKAEWTIRGKKGSKVTITAGAPSLDTVSTTVVLQ
jgi:hypothetical protein